MFCKQKCNLAVSYEPLCVELEIIHLSFTFIRIELHLCSIAPPRGYPPKRKPLALGDKIGKSGEY